MCFRVHPLAYWCIDPDKEPVLLIGLIVKVVKEVRGLERFSLNALKRFSTSHSEHKFSGSTHELATVEGYSEVN